MTEYITASFDTLLGQASETAATYMRVAKLEIDRTFGEGYATSNPQLVAAFISAAASDMNAATNAKVLGYALQEIASSLVAISNSMERMLNITQN